MAWGDGTGGDSPSAVLWLRDDGGLVALLGAQAAAPWELEGRGSLPFFLPAYRGPSSGQCYAGNHGSGKRSSPAAAKPGKKGL